MVLHRPVELAGVFGQLKYRLQLSGLELPQAVLFAQQRFEDQLAEMLDEPANRLEGKARTGKTTLKIPSNYYNRLSRLPVWMDGKNCLALNHGASILCPAVLKA
jgi:hypothetical protein